MKPVFVNKCDEINGSHFISTFSVCVYSLMYVYVLTHRPSLIPPFLRLYS